ncbi:hypothetical protein MT487_10360 [Lachnospiraceae bacterium NSJ-171]|mgnify:FL=1|jgi:hypothetical protein|nr:hypothetical protein [Lachnospiraceae bacterium NSJ-171]
MARIDKEEQARREGMAYALRIAKEKGIDALEEDLKMRNAIGLPVGVDRKALNQFTENVKFNTVDTMVILMAVTLHDEFGFGEKRVQRAIDRFMFKANCLDEDYTTWQEQIEILKEELGIELSIRANDKDVRC